MHGNSLGYTLLAPVLNCTIVAISIIIVFFAECNVLFNTCHSPLMVHADPTFKENLVTTVEDLLDMNVVPVFNENDAISKGVVKATVRV